MYWKRRRFAGVVSIALVMMMMCTTVFTAYVYAASSPIEIRINLDGTTTPVTTTAQLVKEVLAQQNIEILPEDIVSPALTEKLSPDTTVTVKKAKQVQITFDEAVITEFTAQDITRELLGELGIPMNEQDYFTQYINAQTGVRHVSVVRVTEENETQDVAIESDVLEIKTDELEIGQTQIAQQGQTGWMKQTYQVRRENGQEVSRVLLSEEVTQRPVDTIKKVGTAQPKKKIGGGASIDPATSTIITADGKQLHYNRVIDMTATAYDLSYASCGKRPGDKGYGITASGMKARVGVVAVDRNVIPLGTKLYIVSPDGSWTYGESIAGDTGGGIKGNRVDLFFNTYNECIQFGRRTARVYVLD